MCFNVSMLRKYRSDPFHVVLVEEFELREDMSYEEEPVRILDVDTKVLRGKTIDLVKVLWKHRGVEEATWETRKSMEEQFPHLFTSGKFRGRNFLKRGRVVTSRFLGY